MVRGIKLCKKSPPEPPLERFTAPPSRFRVLMSARLVLAKYFDTQRVNIVKAIQCINSKFGRLNS